MKTSMTCIQDLVMEDGKIEAIKGKTYEFELNEKLNRFEFEDESGHLHHWPLTDFNGLLDYFITAEIYSKLKKHMDILWGN